MATNYEDLSTSPSSDTVPDVDDPTSPAESVSHDSYSVISGSDLLDEQDGQDDVDASSQPGHQSDLSQEMSYMAESNAVLQLELSKAKIERNQALQKLETQQATKKSEDAAIQKQLEVLSEDGKDKISKIPALIIKYQEAIADTTLGKRLFEGQTQALERTLQEGLEKSTEIRRLRVDKKNLEDRNVSSFNEMESSMYEIERLKTVVKQLALDKEELKTVITLRNDEMRSLGEVNSFLQTRIDNLRACVEEGQRKRGQLDEEVRDLKNEVTTLKQEKAKLPDGYDVNEYEVKDLEKRPIKEYRHKVSLQNKVTKRNENISDLQNEVATLKVDDGNLEGRIQNLTNKIERLADWSVDILNEMTVRDDDVNDYKEKLNNARWRGRRLKKQRDSALAAKKHDG